MRPSILPTITAVVAMSGTTALVLRTPTARLRPTAATNLCQHPSKTKLKSNGWIYERCCRIVDTGTVGPGRRARPHSRGAGVSSLRASWIDEQVSLELPTSSSEAYSLYADLRRQPEWSPWLKSVEHDSESGESMWVIQSRGIKVSWNAQNTVEVPGSEVAWESTTGLSNKGKVTFQDTGHDRCMMTLTLSYNLPGVIARVMKINAVEKYVKWTLLGDLSRFKKILAKEHKERTKEFANVLVQSNGKEAAAEIAEDERTTAAGGGAICNKFASSTSSRPASVEPEAPFRAGQVGEPREDRREDGDTDGERIARTISGTGSDHSSANSVKEQEGNDEGKNSDITSRSSVLLTPERVQNDDSSQKVENDQQKTDSHAAIVYTSREYANKLGIGKNARLEQEGSEPDIETGTGRAWGARLWRALRGKGRQQGQQQQESNADVGGREDGFRKRWRRRFRRLMRREIDGHDAQLPNEK